MTVTLNIPEELSGELTNKLGNLGRAALEALAAKAYEQDCLSLEQVRSLLDLESRWEAQSLLSRLGVWPGTTVEDLRCDLATLDRFTLRD
jgi:hypothetical protein